MHFEQPVLQQDMLGGAHIKLNSYSMMLLIGGMAKEHLNPPDATFSFSSLQLKKFCFFPNAFIASSTCIVVEILQAIPAIAARPYTAKGEQKYL